MKRLLTLAAMFLCCMATTFAQFSGSGSGTENDPYLILNPIHLNQMRNYLNQSDVYFKLMANIDVSEFIEDEWSSQGWMPIGTSSTHFKGVLDGNDKSISGLWINRPSADYIGLFAYTEGATIKNLTINSSSIKGKSHVGTISGYSQYTTFNGCEVFSSNDVIGSGENVGGVVGSVFDGSISECIVICNNITGENCVGGIYGKYHSTNTSHNTSITACRVQGNVNGGNYVGGICGYGKGNLSNTNFCGNVTANSNAGGICGMIESSTINACYAVSNIVATGNQIGGLIGELAWCNLKNSYQSGSVTGNEQVGGLVGYFHGDRNYSIEKCYSKTHINGAKSVGGLVGKFKGFSYSYKLYLLSNVSICSSVKATVGNVGRIYGEKDSYTAIGEMGTVNENKAWNKAIVINAGVAQDITDDEPNGTGVSATTLKLKATYVAMGWDFNDIWAIQETECYPYMKSQTAPPVITSQVVSGATTISGKCVDGGTITLEIDGEKQTMVSSGNNFSFNVSPLQAGHEVRISAKAEGKEMSYYTTETVAYLGKGTEVDPYQVYTAADLTGVYRKGYFKLMNDIDLTEYINQFSPTEGWESIGREGSETIHFDGNGHKITGLWCNSTRDNTGLFSCFANGEIKNLTVETAKGKQVKGGANTGIIIGKMMNGTIENCRVSGNVTDGTPVGGIVGLFDGGKISLSQANVTINTTGENSYVGGLVGEITSGEIDQCVTLGTLTGTGNESYVGGLVGKNSSSITNSYSNAKVTSSYNAAGLVAYNYGLVDKCYATGDLFSNNFGAGVVGYNDGANAIVKNCVAMNNKIVVTFESQQQQQSGGYGQRIIGGLKNNAPDPEMNNYALKTMQVSVNNEAKKVYDDIMNGSAKTGADLMKFSTYQELGWDFSQTWTIIEGEGYPSLKNNEAVVGKAEEEPEPTPTTDDKLTVATVNTSTGKTATIGINLENLTTDLTAYQFDLVLPEGFTLATDDKGKLQVTKTSRYEDESQQLTVSLQDDGSYRFICFSLSNGKIEGTNGAILNAVMASADNVTAGTYEGTIKNIVFTKVDGTQLKLSDAKFIIVVSNMIMGDANGDGEVNVSDIVEIVNYIMGKPSANFVQAAADLNGDGEVNVTDIVKVVSIIMSNNSSSAPMRRSAVNSNLTLSGDGQVKTAMVQHAEQFTAAQFDIILADGQEIDDIRLNSNSNHYLTWKMTEEGRCRVVVYSLTNSAFNVEDSELMSISLKGSNKDVVVGNVILVAAYGNTTGISKVTTDKSVESWYTLDGRKLDCQPTKKGIYIRNGKKLVVR